MTGREDPWDGRAGPAGVEHGGLRGVRLEVVRQGQLEVVRQGQQGAQLEVVRWLLWVVIS